MDYTKPELLRLISMATVLGFEDDVAHWTEKLTALEEGSDS